MKQMICIVLWLFCMTTNGQNYPDIPKEKFHLYLLAGQSNMAGRGRVEPQDTAVNPRILMLNRNGEWEIAREPLHFDKKEAGTGPGLAFAREMLAGDDIVIGLIPCAAGGSGIDRWRPGEFWEQTKSFPYDDAVARTKRAMNDGTLKGILWHQGEGDSSPSKVAAYKENLRRLVAAFRKEFNAPEIPFIAGELGEFWNDSGLNAVLHEAKSDICNYDVVSAAGLKDKGDHTHFDAPSQRILGQRYAVKMKKLPLSQVNAQQNPVECEKDKPILQGDGITDDAEVIQALLDSEMSVVYLPPPKKFYLIGKALRIHSNQMLRLDRTTIIRLADNANDYMITNADRKNGNINLHISGGVWDGNNLNQLCEYRKKGAWGHKTILENMGSIFYFLNVKNLHIENLTLKDPEMFG
ncbi:MAG: hypothetical protein LBB64_06405, partial [Dysgonamonadaceae bacterium]|nr:hypothetical protein [Dysgonamonadaceae bacterium]